MIREEQVCFTNLSGSLIYDDVIANPHAQALALKLGRHKSVKLQRWTQPSPLLVLKLDLKEWIALFSDHIWSSQKALRDRTKAE